MSSARGTPVHARAPQLSSPVRRQNSTPPRRGIAPALSSAGTATTHDDSSERRPLGQRREQVNDQRQYQEHEQQQLRRQEQCELMDSSVANVLKASEHMESDDSEFVTYTKRQDFMLVVCAAGAFLVIFIVGCTLLLVAPGLCRKESPDVDLTDVAGTVDTSTLRRRAQASSGPRMCTPRTETFRMTPSQKGKEGVDFVFVVDKSDSMAYELELLANSSETLMSKLNASGMNYTVSLVNLCSGCAIAGSIVQSSTDSQGRPTVDKAKVAKFKAATRFSTGYGSDDTCHANHKPCAQCSTSGPCEVYAKTHRDCTGTFYDSLGKLCPAGKYDQDQCSVNGCEANATCLNSASSMCEKCACPAQNAWPWAASKPSMSDLATVYARVTKGATVNLLEAGCSSQTGSFSKQPTATIKCTGKLDERLIAGGILSIEVRRATVKSATAGCETANSCVMSVVTSQTKQLEAGEVAEFTYTAEYKDDNYEAVAVLYRQKGAAPDLDKDDIVARRAIRGKYIHGGQTCHVTQFSHPSCKAGAPPSKYACSSDGYIVDYLRAPSTAADGAFYYLAFYAAAYDRTGGTAVGATMRIKGFRRLPSNCVSEGECLLTNSSLTPTCEKQKGVSKGRYCDGHHHLMPVVRTCRSNPVVVSVKTPSLAHAFSFLTRSQALGILSGPSCGMCDASFLRDDALLHVVLVSDEGKQGVAKSEVNAGSA